MSSDFGRGFKFGMGCALGGAFILTLFLLGLSMCAGELQRRLLEEFKEQMRDMVPFPPKRERAEIVYQHGPVGLPFSADSSSEFLH
ncbi:MAG: hypothetical protein NZ578_16565 [Candidatus Binatia bacterium]|nr:hypothetical protein [Candidatus Binatia bacterium]